MKGEEQPILIVDEGRVDFVLHDGRLAAELRAQVRKLHRLARLVFPLVGDLVGLGLPDPRSREFDPGEVGVERIADTLDVPERIEAIGLADLFGNWRSLLSPGACSKHQHPESQNTDRRETARICHSHCQSSFLLEAIPAFIRVFIGPTMHPAVPRKARRIDERRVITWRLRVRCWRASPSRRGSLRRCSPRVPWRARRSCRAPTVPRRRSRSRRARRTIHIPPPRPLACASFPVWRLLIATAVPARARAHGYLETSCPWRLAVDHEIRRAARPRSRAGRSALVSKTRHAAEVRLDCASTREVFWMDWHAPKSA